MEVKPLIEVLISHGLVGGVVCMAVFIFGLHREWWVMGAHFRAAVKDKDEYKALLRTAETSAEDTRKLLADLSERLP